MKKKKNCVHFLFGFAAVSLVASSALATTYSVNRSFTDGFGTASLVGTVDIPQGNYTLQNAPATPFTNVNLTLTVNSTPYPLTNSLTDLILFNGQFLINAGPTTLIFDTANADGSNPADLIFSDNFAPTNNNRYVIGYNGTPGFEVGYTDSGSVVVVETFPTIFGVVVPEPSALILISLGAMALTTIRRRKM